MEWTGQVLADTPTVAVAEHIEAPPQRVWNLVSDIHLMAKLSSELQEVEWLDGVSGPAVGHRFTGRNAHEALGKHAEAVAMVELEMRVPLKQLLPELPDPEIAVMHIDVMQQHDTAG